MLLSWLLLALLSPHHAASLFASAKQGKHIFGVPDGKPQNSRT
jgi:hypothetical protein